MSKKYTKNDILAECQKYLDSYVNSDGTYKMSHFYKERFVEYIGTTKGIDEFSSEIIADFLLKHQELLESIPQINRKTNYNVGTHDGKYNPATNRIEETLAMDMFNKSKEKDFEGFKNIGKVIDYQTPINGKNADKSGKIDLLSIKGNTMYILELKRQDNRETMLRCVLECYTYWKSVDHEKLKKSFSAEDVKFVKAAPLVYYKGFQWDEMQQARPKLKELMKKLDVAGPFYYETSGVVCR